jgi:hypothetical protein
MGGACSTHVSYRKCTNNIWVRKPEGRSCWELGRRWKGNIGTDLRKIGWEGVDWMRLCQHSMVGFCEHGNEPSASIKGGEFLDKLCDYTLVNKYSAAWS